MFEKAGAKYWGRYEKMNFGLEVEGFYILTGYPSKHFGVSKYSPEQLYKLISDFDEKKYPMSAACHHKGNGLVTGHAYTLIGAQTVAGTRLIRVRNPHSKERYNGSWRDGSVEYNNNKAELEKHGFESNNRDGAFWIPIENFMKSFPNWTVNYYDESFKVARFPVTMKANTTQLEGTLINPVDQFAIIGTAAWTDRTFAAEKDCSKSKYEWPRYSFRLAG